MKVIVTSNGYYKWEKDETSSLRNDEIVGIDACKVYICDLNDISRFCNSSMVCTLDGKPESEEHICTDSFKFIAAQSAKKLM